MRAAGLVLVSLETLRNFFIELANVLQLGDPRDPPTVNGLQDCGSLGKLH